MDMEGRVLRFDSFSKIMSSGLRLGFVTGPTRLLHQIELHMQTSSMHTSSLSQVLLYKLLAHWGKEGLVSHFMHVRNFYIEKRNFMISAVENHLRGKHCHILDSRQNEKCGYWLLYEMHFYLVRTKFEVTVLLNCDSW